MFIGISNARPGTGLYVKGRYLYDRCDEKVILRGVNDMVTWSARDGKTFPEIAKTGANVVRIVVSTSDSPTQLDSWITTCYQNKMFPMPELHEATGKWANLPSLFTYWTRSDIVTVLKKHEHYLLLNIGNEVGDNSVTANQWINDYGSGIKKMRGQGIHACVVVDGTDWGKNIGMIIKNGADLLAQDPDTNVLFSAHAYWPLMWGWSDQKVKDTLQAGVNTNLAFIIGEFGNEWEQTANGAIPYKTLMDQCQVLEIGWIAWSWGPGNNPQTWLDMTSSGTFASLKGWGLEVATTSAASIKNTSKRPTSVLTGACGATGVLPQEQKEVFVNSQVPANALTVKGPTITPGLRDATIYSLDGKRVQVISSEMKSGKLTNRMHEGVYLISDRRGKGALLPFVR
ncbi:MAG: cellulase family glycosylhydrolase [Chitinispirillaceae bacterium]|nr:cellulase family glycosylhydrolase [Chitinispirillaceae bacterium]